MPTQGKVQFNQRIFIIHNITERRSIDVTHTLVSAKLEFQESSIYNTQGKVGESLGGRGEEQITRGGGEAGHNDPHLTLSGPV